MYVFIPVEELCNSIDITKECALTLFSYLESYYLQKDGDYFIRLFNWTSMYMNLRFYVHSVKEVAEENIFVKTALETCSIRDGVYKCSIPQVCNKMKIPPFEIPRILNELQTKEKLTYELDTEAFCLYAYKLKDNIPEITRVLYEQATKIEDNVIRKLNSIYIVARILSIKSVDYVIKVRAEQQKQAEGKANRIGQSLVDINTEHSNEMNKLINTYFLSTNFEKIEEELAGEQAVSEYIPIKSIDNSKEIKSITEDVNNLLNSSRIFETKKQAKTNLPDTYTWNEIVKILLGISSNSISLTLFKNNPFWGKYKEYNYKDVIKHVSEIWEKYQINNWVLKDDTLSYKLKRMKQS